MPVPLEIDYRAIGRRARQLREALRLTQADVAERIEVSCSFVGHIERGEKIASVATIVKLASALGTTTDYLLLGIKHTCAREECALYEDFKRLFRAYGIRELENEWIM